MKTQQISRNYNEYLLNAIDSEGYDVEISTNEDKVKFLADCFQKEFSHEIKRNGGHKALMSWLQGLPSCINLPFYYCDIISLAKEMGGLPEHATSAQEDKITDNYYNYMAVKITQLCKKYKVQLY